MPQPGIDRALALHQSGNLPAAQSAYSQILIEQPNDPMALHYLGVIAHQTGRPQEAMEYLRRSIEAAPQVPDFYCNLGVLMRDMRRLDDAAAAFCHAIKLRPRFPQALCNLGDILRQQGRLAEAESVLRQSFAMEAQHPALFNLGLVLMDARRLREAQGVFRDALKLNPGERRTLKALGMSLLLDKRPAEALEHYKAAVAQDANDADAWFGLANSLRETSDYAAAVVAYRQAEKLSPNHHDLLTNLAATLIDLADYDAAIEAGCRAVSLRPTAPQARYNLSLALLATGRLAEGWQLYESRWHCPGYFGSLLVLPQPVWDGRDISGKTILLRAEQGCGDTIQFCRYIPLLARRGARIILECQEELKSLLSNLGGVGRVVARGEEPGEFDCHLPLVSLPLFFQTTLHTIPNRIPYLKAPAQAMKLPPGFKCGLVWQGSRIHRNDRNRSIPLELLAPLARVPGVHFFSLQTEAVGPQKVIPGLVDLSGSLKDFADSAAALNQMDLLISVDTAPAHLAGALGRPVWTMLPHAADWRWMCDRADTPWYPTMRLFRQERRGEWKPVIERVAAELTACARLAIAA